jgi:uncharacterized membrane protein YphA (DoxX/SURF4 family)
MDNVVWVCQGLLAVLFLASGCAKISMSRERLLATGQTGIAPFPMPLVRLAAASELLGAVGLILCQRPSCGPRWWPRKSPHSSGF